MRFLRGIAVAGCVAMLCATGTAGESDEIPKLKKELEAQKALNQELLRRLEALEASQKQMNKKIESVSKQVPNVDEIRTEQELLIDELREEFAEFDERLDLLPYLGGYYDFEYFNDDRSDSPGEFRQHHISLFLSKEIEDFRFFSELEFEYGTKFEGGGGKDLKEARGEVKVEQGWGEYLWSDLLILRGGLILTPGYWNVNHYPNVVLPTRRPLMVRKVYPESFVGLMGYGTKYWDEFGVTYTGYLGNGVSDDFTKNDDNEGKAVGGRLSFHVPTGQFFDTFDVGLSGYHESPVGVVRTRTWGVDTQLRKGPFELLSELAKRTAAEDRTGFYVQPSYRFNEKWAVFYRYDSLRIERDDNIQEHSVGVNFRPLPDISLKVEYFRSRHSADEDFNGVAASFAVAF